MRICIYGAGAVGGLLGGRLSAAGHDVTLIARGAHLAAMRTDGLKLEDRGDSFHVHPSATDDPSEAGAQDAIILTMKAHGVAAAARALQPMLGPDTTVVTLQNGLPWWYFADRNGAAPRSLESVDPGGTIRAAIPADRVIGGVAIAGASMPAPGEVRCIGGGAFILGELDGPPRLRTEALAGVITGAGFKVTLSERIRAEIWSKLLGNVSFSSIAVLTGSAIGPLVADADMRDLARRLMEEAFAVAQALGHGPDASIDERMSASSRMGAHKTSILQDLEAGRPMEVDAMVGSVVEAARIAGVAVPLTETMYGLVRRRAMTAGCYPDNPALAAALGKG